MAEITKEILTRHWNQGEQNISVEMPFLVDRFSPVISMGVGEYILPSYVQSIRRITYRGQKLDPMPFRNRKDIFQSATQISKPFWYIHNNVGLNKINLFPIPAENLAAGVIDLWKDDIPNCCIVEFNRVTDNSTFIIPSYLRRQLLKQYVGRQISFMEGSSQDMKLSKEFDDIWQNMKMEFLEFLESMHNRARKLVVGATGFSNPTIRSPTLPIDRFGTSVDPGE